MEVVITSSELIKPSSPTPLLQTQIPLSFLDQMNHLIFSPIIYFYPFSSLISKGTHEHLKRSLSKTLSIFYPLAGRLKNDIYLTCSDDGVPYFEARANTHLSQIIGENPDYNELEKLFPDTNDHRITDSGNVLLAIKVTFFACGGMSIAFCFSHKFMDGLSMIKFVNSFAAISRGDDKESKILPQFGAAHIFPPVPGTKASVLGMKEEDKLVTRKFVFSDFAISALKTKYTSPDLSLTRVEALSIFIVTRFVDVTTQEARKVKRWYRVIQAVNLRPRAIPPLPESLFSNLSRFPMTKPFYANNAKEDCFRLVMSMRDATRKVDNCYIDKLRNGNMDPALEYKQFKNLEGAGTSFSFSAINRFPLYNADFGWGRPVWLTMVEKAMKNVVIFMSTRSGEGIETVINLVEDDMACLEADKEFLSYVSPPSITKTLFPSCNL